MTRTIEIPITEELLRLLDARVRQSGLKREEYISTLLSKDLSGPPTLSEVLAPFREQVSASGATDEELAHLFSAAREEAFRETRP